MKNSLLQVRVDNIDKKKASVIAESLGLDLSTIVNMMLKQIIIQNKIPFEIKGDDTVQEINATEALEGCILSGDMINDLYKIKNGEITADEEIDCLIKKYQR